MDKLLSFYQSNLPGLENMTADDLACEGCFSDNRTLFCETCAVKDCNQGKGYTGCHECDEFPCQLIEDFPIPVGKKGILRSIAFRKKYGTDKWIAAEEARYICPDCGNTVFRGVKRCNNCKAELNLD